MLRKEEMPVQDCIHCGLCRDVCPQGLMPDRIEFLYLSGEKYRETTGHRTVSGADSVLMYVLREGG